MSKPVLRLVLGDQLNGNHSWFLEEPTSAHYVLMEVREEASYVRHHIQKVVVFFAAMREFARELVERGFQVTYISLDDTANRHSLAANVRHLIDSGQYSAFEYQQPDEFRVAEDLRVMCSSLNVPTRVVGSEHFLTESEFFEGVFRGHKRCTMELFYREVRKRYGFLMDGEEPIGDRWNFDAENRKKLPASVKPPPPLEFNRDVTELETLIRESNIPTLGTINAKHFAWPISRGESLELVEYFCRELLPYFGAYQDAMHTDHRFVFHSRLSVSLNLKLISPREVIEAAIRAFEKGKGRITIEQVEGFVRQIAGWREFMRGIYWRSMPRFKSLNVLGASRPLPHYFWDGNTKMNCVGHAVRQSLEESYAHHIQRLMITGNFCALAGVSPDEVDEWYLGIYADAIEWVQLPNTRGMSQFADGGIVGTKPYVSSAQYVNKMSNYCAGCYYNYKEKFGERGCPFNTLYWDFLMRNREQLERNPRIGMGYRLLAKMSEKDKKEIAKKADSVLSHLEEL